MPPTPDMFGYAEMAWTRALELEEARMDKQKEEEGVGENGESLSLYRGDKNGEPPHFPVENRLFPKCHD